MRLNSWGFTGILVSVSMGLSFGVKYVAPLLAVPATIWIALIMVFTPVLCVAGYLVLPQNASQNTAKNTAGDYSRS